MGGFIAAFFYGGRGFAAVMEADVELFLGYLKQGMSRRKAYRLAFGCEGLSGNAVDGRARRLLKKPEVWARYLYLKGEGMGMERNDAIADDREVLAYLTAVMRGEGSEQMPVKQGDALKAAELIGKKYGLFSEKAGKKEELVQIVDDIPVGGDGGAALE